MILAFLSAISLSRHEQKVINVVVAFQGAFRPSDDSRRALFEVIAKQRLLLIRGLEILEISTIHIVRARIFTLICIAHKSLDVDGILSEKHVNYT